MIITQAEIFPKHFLPGTEDRMAAARTSSFFCWIAAVWFFVFPWTYFGVSEERSGWNAWIVGGLMVVASLVRVIHPQGTTVFSMANAVLSVWVLVSPFVFGYSGDTGRLINTLAVGAVTLSFSLLSLLISKDVNTRIGTADASEQEGELTTPSQLR